MKHYINERTHWICSITYCCGFRCCGHALLNHDKAEAQRCDGSKHSKENTKLHGLRKSEFRKEIKSRNNEDFSKFYCFAEKGN